MGMASSQQRPNRAKAHNPSSDLAITKTALAQFGRFAMVSMQSRSSTMAMGEEMTNELESP
jgi:hypothetical protein